MGTRTIYNGNALERPIPYQPCAVWRGEILPVLEDVTDDRYRGRVLPPPVAMTLDEYMGRPRLELVK